MSLRCLLPSVCSMAMQQRFAGHAKWQNIAHTKAANDKKRGALINKFCMRIRRAAALGGSADPKINDKLRNTITDALKANIPRATIDRQLEKAKNIKLKQELVEVMAPGGAFLLCDVETDSISKTRQEFKKILRHVKG